MGGDYIVKVEEGREGVNGKPSTGPVFRSIYAKHGLMQIPPSLQSPCQLFRYTFVCENTHICLCMCAIGQISLWNKYCAFCQTVCC